MSSQWEDIREHARGCWRNTTCVLPIPTPRAGSLSGGNQQKVVLARELSSPRPTVLVADNPTWGLDVGAIDYVHRRLLEMRDAGGAIC